MQSPLFITPRLTGSGSCPPLLPPSNPPIAHTQGGPTVPLVVVTPDTSAQRGEGQLVSESQERRDDLLDAYYPIAAHSPQAAAEHVPYTLPPPGIGADDPPYQALRTAQPAAPVESSGFPIGQSYPYPYISQAAQQQPAPPTPYPYGYPPYYPPSSYSYAPAPYPYAHPPPPPPPSLPSYSGNAPSSSNAPFTGPLELNQGDWNVARESSSSGGGRIPSDAKGKRASTSKPYCRPRPGRPSNKADDVAVIPTAGGYIMVIYVPVDEVDSVDSEEQPV
ncbi:hypothetical protein OF83DRAFT_406776 [Amylostereum chailletii]|nr:hypothetical protein OF83DRAFT_406776 [Amylostereum chailletii]